MSSIITKVILLILISSFGSNADDFQKQMICEKKTNYIDSIVEFKEYRYFMIQGVIYEYDHNFNFRRRVVLAYDLGDFDLQDEYRSDLIREIEMGKYLSGFYVPPINCSNDIILKENCTDIQNNLNNVIVVIIYNSFLNTYQVVAKRYFSGNNIYKGIRGCEAYVQPTNQSITEENTSNKTEENVVSKNETNGSNGGANTEPNSPDGGSGGASNETNGSDGGNVGEDDDESAPTSTPKPINPKEDCGPYKSSGRGKGPRDWLLKGLPENRRHKFLPLFFDPKKLELIVIMNKEYEMFGENPSLIREHAMIYWKSMKYEDPGFGWNVNKLSDDYTYTAFLKDKQNVYLIAEPFQQNREAARGPSFLLLFDMEKKTFKNTKRNVFELFGCSPHSNELLGYIIMAVLVIILIIVISLWIFGCYWFYKRNERTTYAQSLKEEPT